jgi:hypothetical protein
VSKHARDGKRYPAMISTPVTGSGASGTLVANSQWAQLVTP